MNRNFKYSLDKSSRKFLCPNCNKKTFVKFVDNETNHYVNVVDGRCDRESKCGYFKKPDNNCVTTSNTICNTKVIQTSFHSIIVLQQYCNNKQQSNFITYLLRNFETSVVIQVIEKYHIGTTNYWNCATIFWQIDQNKMIRGGKIMLYNSETGKRVKQPYKHISWMHKQLKLNNFVLQQCLFGLHNLNSISKSDTICIVESEKTAIIMSIVIPNFLWLATGSKSGFKEQMLLPIKKYTVIAYPDKTEFDSWNETAILLNQKGFNIKCSDLLENIELEKGDDLVNFIDIHN